MRSCAPCDVATRGLFQQNVVNRDTSLPRSVRRLEALQPRGRAEERRVAAEVNRRRGRLAAVRDRLDERGTLGRSGHGGGREGGVVTQVLSVIVHVWRGAGHQRTSMRE